MKLLLLLPLLFLCSCATLDKLYKENITIVPASTNYVEQIYSNTITGVLTTQNVEVITPSHSITNLESNPIVTGTITAIGAIPVPWSGVVGGGLALLYSTYRLWRNKRMVQAVILGVEEARNIIRENPELHPLDDKIVAILKRNQETLKVINDVTQVVNKITDITKK